MGLGCQMSDLNFFPLYLSFKVAGLATALTFVVGLILSFLITRKNFFGKSLVEAVVTLPLILPPTVLGYYLLVLIGRQSSLGRFLKTYFHINLVFTWQAAVIAATVAALPLFIRSAQASLESIDKNLIDVARTLGKSDWRIFFAVSLPLAWRGIFSGLVLAFARALGEFGATLMVAGNIPGKTQTMPLAIYDAVVTGNSGVAGALSLIITLIAIVVLLTVTWLAKNRLDGY